MAGKASAPHHHPHPIDAQLSPAGLTREQYALASAIADNEVEYRKNGALHKDEHHAMLSLVNATDKGATGTHWARGIDIIPALLNQARAVWTVNEDPEDPTSRQFLAHRVNDAADPGGLRFVSNRQNGRVEWDPEPIVVRGEVAPRAPARTTNIAKAMAWLNNYLNGKVATASEVLASGGRAGHARRALYEAKGRLGGSVLESEGRCRWAVVLGNGRFPIADGQFADGQTGGRENSKLVVDDVYPVGVPASAGFAMVPTG